MLQGNSLISRLLGVSRLKFPSLPHFQLPFCRGRLIRGSGGGALAGNTPDWAFTYPISRSLCGRMSERQVNIKPPNILIYSKPENFESLKTSISRCILEDRFTVYKLQSPELSEIWMKNCVLLVVDNETLPKDIMDSVRTFWETGGKVLGFCPGLTENIVNEHSAMDLDHKIVHLDIDILGPNMEINIMNPVFNVGTASEDIEVLAYSAEGHVPLFIQVTNTMKTGFAVLSQGRFKYNMETDFLLAYLLKKCGISCKEEEEGEPDVQLTPFYLLTPDKEARKHFWHLVEPQLEKSNFPSGNGNFVSLKLPRDGKKVALVTSHEESSSSSPSFDQNEYFHNLKTKCLGRLVLYSDITTSTMDVASCDGLPHGLVCVARRQTKGKGRSGNDWLSPEGCAMFSAVLKFGRRAKMVGHLPMLQHIVALSVVEGIRSIPGYSQLDVRIKWPNDVYCGRGLKVGGVIVNTTANSENVVCTIGCGINVSNDAPTICINELMRQFSLTNECEPVTLSIERVICLTLNQLEQNLEAFEVEGPRAILPSYYSKWLHSDQSVNVSVQGALTPAKVIGLDDYGFLTVVLEGSKVIQSVHPDGNSFDMTQNLILPKSTT